MASTKTLLKTDGDQPPQTAGPHALRPALSSLQPPASSLHSPRSTLHLLWTSLQARIVPLVCALCAIGTGTGALAYAEAGHLGSTFHARLIVLGGVVCALSGAAGLHAILRMGRLARERASLRAELAAAALERDLALAQRLAYEKRVESLSLMREIHRTRNINSKHERLRRILTVMGEISGAADITLFSLSALGADPVPTAYFRSGADYELFLRTDKPAPPGIDYYCRDVSVLMQANRCELRGDLCAIGAKYGTAELLLTLTEENRPLAERDPAALLEQMVGVADISDEHIAVVLEERKAIRCEIPGTALCELTYPLITEGQIVGAMKLRVEAERIHRRRGDSGVLASGGGLCGRELEEALAESSRHIAMAVKREEDSEKAVTDGLTGLLIKRQFTEDLRRAFCGEAGGSGEPFSLLMIDIDHFKRVNDVYGHPTGDLILKGVASVLRRKIRGCDVAYRYGGEEMAVILPGADLAAAVATAQRVREAVQATTFLGARGETIPITLSVGAARREPGLPGPHELLERADQALYHAKRTGRNRVCRWPLPRRRAAGARKSLLSERSAPKRIRRSRASKKIASKSIPRKKSKAG